MFQVKKGKKRGKGRRCIKGSGSTKETSNIYNLVLRKWELRNVCDLGTHKIKIEIQI